MFMSTLVKSPNWLKLTIEGSKWRLLLERGEMLTWRCSKDNDWTPGEKKEDDLENQAQNLKPCQKLTPTTSNHQVHIRKTFSSQYLFSKRDFDLLYEFSAEIITHISAHLFGFIYIVSKCKRCCFFILSLCHCQIRSTSGPHIKSIIF